MEKAFELAKKQFAAFGVDAEAALERVAKIPVSIHCWQGDDIHGFVGSGELTGGIQTTGNYPGAARNPAELMADFDEVLKLVPGKKRINLHAIYAISDKPVEMDKLRYDQFEKWVEYAQARGIGIDFNPTLFSHPMVVDGLTLSSPKKEVREYWINHVKACRAVSAEIGKRLGTPCLCNLWIADGFKDTPADRLGPRLRLKESLDEIYSVKYPAEYLVDSVESKVFGIGVESYTTGSNEFYQNYAAKSGVCCLLDNGHYHPLEYVSDKIPSLLAFYDKVALHVTRGVRWDSDHVIRLEDEILEIAKEIIRNGADEKVLIGLDYFDASINRVAAWVTGARNMQRALLIAALQPHAQMKKLQDEAKFTDLLVLSEEIKTLPYGAVWEEYLRRQNTPGSEWFGEVRKYEKEVLSKR
ncbi:MAG TPA: L-rhamnose isomerase [Candidatus Borkfalkia avicola]|uniref:L-rhamnose isomerase n=1 Tax=Candidatus Borkfalkia avicola TaxID=2838503 RepID=A0A9D2D890_9FIRM|nr:L-rhamnose isomerase [Candidatus Borkfalkia avicola]